MEDSSGLVPKNNFSGKIWENSDKKLLLNAVKCQLHSPQIQLKRTLSWLLSFECCEMFWNSFRCRKYFRGWFLIKSPRLLQLSHCRSCRLKMFFKIGVLKKIAIFIGRHLRSSLFFIQLQAYKKSTGLECRIFNK